MPKPSPSSPESLQALAAAQGIAATLHGADQPMPTVEMAAAALGIPIEEMTKNLLFLVAGRPVLVIARGTERVDKRRVAQHWQVGGKKVKLATAEQTLEISGFEAGCVPSFGHRVPLPTLIDESVVRLPRVYGGTSDPMTLISLAPDDLLVLTQGTVLPLTLPPLSAEKETETAMSEQVGFIGLGIMGRGMVRNLLRAGHEVAVWNRTASRMDDLAQEGARPTGSAQALAAQCDLIFLCVSDTPDVEAVILGEQGIVHGVRPGSLVVDMSTISPQATREMAARLAENEVKMLDAPVSGGSEGAERGTLSIMVGGEAEQVARAMPYFEAMGKTITHVGGQGAGQLVKLVNQILVVGNALAMSEALLFAQAGGLDLQQTLDAVTQGAAGSWMLSHRGPQIIRRDWRPGFTIDLQQKDMRLVLDTADQLGVPLLASSLVFNLYRTLQAAGLGSEGNHALVKALERLAGVTVGGAAEEEKG